jgi:hypothetical protein
MAIKQSFSYRKIVPANTRYKINFNEFLPDEKPNSFQMRNFNSSDTLYVSSRSDVSATEYEINIPAGATRVLTIPYNLIEGLYFYIATETNIIVNAFYSTEVYPQDLDQTGQTIIVNYESTPIVKINDGTETLLVNADGSINVVVGGTVEVDTLPELPAGDNNIGNVDVVTLPELPAGDNNIGNVDVVTLPELPAGDNNIGNVDVVTLPELPAGDNNIGNVDVVTLPDININTKQPVAEKVTLSAGVTATVKSSAGFVYAVKTALTDLQVENDTSQVWKDGYEGCHPIYFDTSIKLTSATGGDVYIVYL